MTTTRRALLGFVAGLPLALRSMMGKPEPIEFGDWQEPVVLWNHSEEAQIGRAVRTDHDEQGRCVRVEIALRNRRVVYLVGTDWSKWPIVRMDL